RWGSRELRGTGWKREHVPHVLSQVRAGPEGIHLPRGTIVGGCATRRQGVYSSHATGRPCPVPAGARDQQRRAEVTRYVWVIERRCIVRRRGPEVTVGWRAEVGFPTRAEAREERAQPWWKHRKSRI